MTATMCRLMTLLCPFLIAAAGQPDTSEAIQPNQDPSCAVTTQQAQPDRAVDSAVSTPAETGRQDLHDPSDIADKWGIEIQSARLSAGGYMIDFRFKVLDPKKAAPLFDRKVRPVLIDRATKAQFAVPSSPKVGMLRTSRTPKPGAIAFVMFANPGNYIKAGSEVTVQIGKFAAADIEVE